jgi:hypothetical protein
MIKCGGKGYGEYGGQFLKVIKALYSGLSATVSMGNIESEMINLEAGVRQGCVLSPICFALYIRDLEERLKEEGLAVDIGLDKRVPGLYFADDRVVMAEGGKDLRRLLNIVGDFGEERKLVFNERNSLIMLNQWEKNVNKEIHSEHSKRRWNIGVRDIKFGEEKVINLGECNEYRYLGVNMGKDVISNHVEGIIKKMNRIRGVLRKISRGYFSRKWVAKIGWERVALPALLYGLEAVYVKEEVIKRLEQQQLEMARFILGVRRYTVLEFLYGELGWITIRDHLWCRKVCFDRQLRY